MQQVAPATAPTCPTAEDNRSSSAAVAEVGMYTSTTAAPASSSQAAGSLEQQILDKDRSGDHHPQAEAEISGSNVAAYSNGHTSNVPGASSGPLLRADVPIGDGGSMDRAGSRKCASAMVIDPNMAAKESKMLTNASYNSNNVPSHSEGVGASELKVQEDRPYKGKQLLEGEGARNSSDTRNPGGGGSGYLLTGLEAVSHQLCRIPDTNNNNVSKSGTSSEAKGRSDLSNMNAPVGIIPTTAGERLQQRTGPSDSSMPRGIHVDGATVMPGRVINSKRVDSLAPMDGTEETASGGALAAAVSGPRRRPGATAPVDIKLFVGRLPPSATEQTIMPLFSRFGPVLEAVMIRDKSSNTHRGSCFVRMASITDADAAIRHLHNSRIPLGTPHPAGQDGLGEQGVAATSSQPIQISYAFGEPERLGFTPGALRPGEDEAKLFIGSLPRDATEQSVGMFFRQFGRCFDPFLILDGARQFRGCGFIKFAFKEEALQAIRQLHGIVVFPGGSRPLELRIAEPRKSATAVGRGALTQQAAAASTGSGAPRFGQPWGVPTRQTPAGGSRYLGVQEVTSAAERFIGGSMPPYESGAVAAMLGGGAYAQLGRRSGSSAFGSREVRRVPASGGSMGIVMDAGSRDMYGEMDGGSFGGSADGASGAASIRRGNSSANADQPFGSIFNPNCNPRAAGPWREYYASDGRVYYHNEVTGITQWEVPSEFAQLTMMMMMMSPQQQQQQQQQCVSCSVPPGATPVTSAGTGRSGYPQLFGDVTGPPGANIFIFHLPNNWTREDLVGYFEPFGTILSAKVALDYVSRRNKGYGFVSYSSIDAAIRAVQQMNLISIGAKRLRVAIKSGEEEQARLFAQRHAIPFQAPSMGRGGASTLTSAMRRHGSLEGAALTRRSTVASQQGTTPSSSQQQQQQLAEGRQGQATLAERNGTCGASDSVGNPMGIQSRFSSAGSALGKLAAGLEYHPTANAGARTSSHDSVDSHAKESSEALPSRN